MAGKGRRYLIVGPSWVGDMMMSQSLYKLLRQRWPSCSIDVLAPRASLPLVSRMPEVNRGIVMKSEHGELALGYRRGLGEQLKSNAYTHAIVLPNSLKSALVPFFADIPERTGFRGEYRYVLINDMRMLSRDRLPRMVDRFNTLGVPLGAELPEPEYPALMVDEDQRAAVMDDLGVDAERLVLGLCPGAEFGDAKRWPEAYFAALADMAIARGMQVWIFGGPNDAAVAHRVRQAVAPAHRDRCHDFAGKTSLLGAIDLLSQCAAVVTNDSGLMHVAAALDVPLAVLYGSTSPRFTPPLTTRADIFTLDLSCSPCFKRTCPLGHKNCLNQLTPDQLEPVIGRASGS